MVALIVMDGIENIILLDIIWWVVNFVGYVVPLPLHADRPTTAIENRT
jgi:hypothetical protein